MNNIAVILAGGSGERFGGKKQFIELAGKPLWKHVYDKACKILPKENVVVVGVDIDGGKTRSFSIINGLKYFYNKQKNYEKVILLEAARPLVTVEQIDYMLKNTKKSSTYIMPLVNTVIKRDGTFCDRDDYFDLLTPQCFDFYLLYKAYDVDKDWNMTDETRLMYETYGFSPEFMNGGQNLLKITYKKDLPFMEHLLEMQKADVI